MSRVELRQQLNQIKMHENKDLKMLFEKIGAVRNAYNTKMRKIDEENLNSGRGTRKVSSRTHS